MTPDQLENYQPKAVPTPSEVRNAVQILVDACFGAGYNAGWWHNIHTGADIRETRNTGELIALCHSELSEALEGLRKDKQDDHLPQYKSSEVELADAIIRICDMAGAKNLKLADAFVDKMAYNASREDHKLDNRLAKGGKKF